MPGFDSDTLNSLRENLQQLSHHSQVLLLARHAWRAWPHVIAVASPAWTTAHAPALKAALALATHRGSTTATRGTSLEIQNAYLAAYRYACHIVDTQGGKPLSSETVAAAWSAYASACQAYNADTTCKAAAEAANRDTWTARTALAPADHTGAHAATAIIGCAACSVYDNDPGRAIIRALSNSDPLDEALIGMDAGTGTGAGPCLAAFLHDLHPAHVTSLIHAPLWPEATAPEAWNHLCEEILAQPHLDPETTQTLRWLRSLSEGQPALALKEMAAWLPNWWHRHPSYRPPEPDLFAIRHSSSR